MRARLILVLAVLCLVAAACGDDDDDGAGAAPSVTADGESTTADDSGIDPDGLVRIAYDLSGAARGPFTWDPSAATSSTGETAVHHWVYGGLLRPAADGSLVPDLAESTTVVDPNTIEIALRDGVTLPDGSPFNAEVVRAALERNLSRPGLPAFGADFYKLSSIEVTDDLTLRLTIPDGTAPSWHDVFLAGPETVIVPPGTNLNEPAGAGPFRVVEYQPQTRVLLEKNPDYWDAESILVAQIELVNAPDVGAGVSALNGGQVDWTRLEITTVDAVSGFEVIATPNPTLLTNFVICKSSEPFDDPRVRQALSMAIDREAISEALYEGTAEPAWDLWPEDHRFHNPDLTGRYDYDPEGARDLLAEAGLEDGFTFDLIPIAVAGMPEVAQIAQQQFAEIGVTANIVASTNFVDDFFNRHIGPVALVPSTGAGGIGKLRQWVGTSIGNACTYNDPELNNLADELARLSGQTDEAVDVWHEIQAKVVDDALSIFVLFQSQITGHDADRIADVATNVNYGYPMPEIRGLYVTE